MSPSALHSIGWQLHGDGKAGKGAEAERQPRDVSSTMTIPAELAALIDRHRAPNQTSRRAWLLKAAEEKLKREGVV